MKGTKSWHNCQQKKYIFEGTHSREIQFQLSSPSNEVWAPINHWQYGTQMRKLPIIPINEILDTPIHIEVVKIEKCYIDTFYFQHSCTPYALGREKRREKRNCAYTRSTCQIFVWHQQVYYHLRVSMYHSFKNKAHDYREVPYLHKGYTKNQNCHSPN